MKSLIFDKSEVCVGTVVKVEKNKKVHHPAYILTFDFGNEIGIKNFSTNYKIVYDRVFNGVT